MGKEGKCEWNQDRKGRHSHTVIYNLKWRCHARCHRNITYWKTIQVPFSTKQSAPPLKYGTFLASTEPEKEKETNEWIESIVLALFASLWYSSRYHIAKISLKNRNFSLTTPKQLGREMYSPWTIYPNVLLQHAAWNQLQHRSSIHSCFILTYHNSYGNIS